MSNAEAQMERIADEIRTRWERSLVEVETPEEREGRRELTRQWYALRAEVRKASRRGQR